MPGVYSYEKGGGTMRKTKIVCTLGPASESPEIIEKMMRCGMNVARFNFSHGTHEYHKKLMNTVKSVRKKLGLPVAILLDTKGPEIRFGLFEGGKAELKKGSEFTLTTRDVVGNEKEARISYDGLARQSFPGMRILVDDGHIVLNVKSVNETDILCEVVEGGTVKDRKGINVPNVHLDMPYLSENDKADLIFGIENNVDFVAASFVRSKEDVIAVRKFLNYNGGHNIRIIAKIENHEGIVNYEEILYNSDGLMVARGDMGVEVEYERLPGIQKKFIKKCFMAGKMVITATQMLESMVTSATPTRAEITDVANAVFDGTSAVMLSGETAAGVNPPRVVSVMSKIVEQAEMDVFDMGTFSEITHEIDVNDVANAICHAACTTARDLRAAAIIAVTDSGHTARRVSKYRPNIPIVAATPCDKTFYQLALSWGVYPVKALIQSDADHLFIHAIDCARELDMVKEGDTVIITAGVPVNTRGTTNLLKVTKVGK